MAANAVEVSLDEHAHVAIVELLGPARRTFDPRDTGGRSAGLPQV